MTLLKNGLKWGDWTLDTEAWILALDTRADGLRHKYEVDLTRVSDSAHMLDWIFQLRMKSWVSNDVMGDLLSAFQSIFHPQSFLCGGGHDQTIDAMAHLKRMTARSEKRQHKAARQSA